MAMRWTLFQNPICNNILTLKSVSWSFIQYIYIYVYIYIYIYICSIIYFFIYFMNNHETFFNSLIIIHIKMTLKLLYCTAFLQISQWRVPTWQTWWNQFVVSVMLLWLHPKQPSISRVLTILLIIRGIAANHNVLKKKRQH